MYFMKYSKRKVAHCTFAFTLLLLLSEKYGCTDRQTWIYRVLPGKTKGPKRDTWFTFVETKGKDDIKLM